MIDDTCVAADREHLGFFELVIEVLVVTVGRLVWQRLSFGIDYVAIGRRQLPELALWRIGGT